MNVTRKQRILFWITALILGAVFYGPTLLPTIRQYLNHDTGAAAGTPQSATEAQFAKLVGSWTTNIVTPEKAFCKLRLELTATPYKPGQYSGYSTIVCLPSLFTSPLQSSADKQALLSNIMNPQTPVTSILRGKIEGDALVLHLDKSIGKSSEGCQTTDYKLTPFGELQLAAEWKQGTCKGGGAVMSRVR
jgi:hypothetical protein